MPAATALFRLTAKTYLEPDSFALKFTPAPHERDEKGWTKPNSANAMFFQNVPAGELSFTGVRKAVADTFGLGEVYRLTAELHVP